MHPQRHLHLLLLLLLITVTATAQSPPTQNNEPALQRGKMSSSMSILFIILISVFIFLAFFSVYIRQYIAMNSTPSTAPPTRVRSVKRHGLNPETLSTFPTLIYSEVKEHNLSKSALECAVCLNEFEDSETLRLLPNCSHAFHTDCIDAWLAAHVTCPVCRCNLTEPVQNKENDTEHVLIEIEGEDNEEEREREMEEFEQFANVKRSGRHFRSYTTGHAGLERGGDLERYTLRLPENVKDAIMLKRTSSCVVFRGEESEKRGFRTTEKLGTFLKRAMSMKNGRFLRWDSGKSEGSVRSKGSSFRHVISQFDCCAGGSGGCGGGGLDYNQLDKVEKLSSTDSSSERFKVSSV